LPADPPVGGHPLMSTATAPARRTRQLWDVGWRHVFAIGVCLYALFPIVVIISVALRPSSTLVGSNRLFETVSLNNFHELNQTQFWTWVKNTLVVATVTSVATVLLGAAAAYAFSRFRFRGRRATLVGLLIIQM